MGYRSPRATRRAHPRHPRPDTGDGSGDADTGRATTATRGIARRGPPQARLRSRAPYRGTGPARRGRRGTQDGRALDLRQGAEGEGVGDHAADVPRGRTRVAPDARP